MCNCEFAPDPSDPDEDTPEKAWHYRRVCPVSGGVWFSLHYEHDGNQWKCPYCGDYHTTPER